MLDKTYYIYIITNKPHGVLYIGVTNNLLNRINQHRQKILDGFSKKYNLTRLVYYEIFDDIEVAISREKQLKKWKRQWKINLINETNPTWRDLFFDILNA